MPADSESYSQLWDRGQSTASWGGNVVQAKDGKYHLFFAEFLNHCPLSSWGTNSVVSRAVSDSPIGPFVKKEVVQPAFHHNPTVALAPDGTYLLLSIGNGSSTPANCSAKNVTTSTPVGDPAAAGIITLSYAKSPEGPWTTLANPILTGRPGKWDYFVTNPSVYFFKNGTVLMAYRGGWSPWHVGIAVATSWKDPFERVSDTYAFPDINEDPGLFRDTRGNFHILTHYFTQAPGGHAFSKDGLSWKFAGQAYNHTIELNNGTDVTISRRERPQVLSVNGTPRYLYTGVQPTSLESFTLVQEIAAD